MDKESELKVAMWDFTAFFVVHKIKNVIQLLPGVDKQPASAPSTALEFNFQRKQFVNLETLIQTTPL